MQSSSPDAFTNAESPAYSTSVHQSRLGHLNYNLRHYVYTKSCHDSVRVRALDKKYQSIYGSHREVHQSVSSLVSSVAGPQVHVQTTGPGHKILRRDHETNTVGCGAPLFIIQSPYISTRLCRKSTHSVLK